MGATFVGPDEWSNKPPFWVRKIGLWYWFGLVLLKVSWLDLFGLKMGSKKKTLSSSSSLYISNNDFSAGECSVRCILVLPCVANQALCHDPFLCAQRIKKLSNFMKGTFISSGFSINQIIVQFYILKINLLTGNMLKTRCLIKKFRR